MRDAMALERKRTCLDFFVPDLFSVLDSYPTFIFEITSFCKYNIMIHLHRPYS